MYFKITEPYNDEPIPRNLPSMIQKNSGTRLQQFAKEDNERREKNDPGEN